MKRRFLFAVVLCLMLGLCACGNNENGAIVGNNNSNTQNEQAQSNGTTNEEPKLSTIEITNDNWTDYFEIKENIYIYKNDFDEIKNVYVTMCTLCLKEEYHDKYVDFDISFEYVFGEFDSKEERYIYYPNHYMYTYNVETCELSKEYISTSNEIGYHMPQTYSLQGNSSMEDVPQFLFFKGGDYDNFKIEGNIATWEQYNNSAPAILRFKGTLTLIEE